MKSRDHSYDLAITAIFLIGLAIPFFANLVPVPVYDDKTIMDTNSFVASADYYSIWTTSYWDGVKKLSQNENLYYRPLFLSLFVFLKSNFPLLRLLVVFMHSCIAYVGWRFLNQRISNASETHRSYLQGAAGLVLAFFLLGPAQVEVTAQAIGLMEVMPLLHGILAFTLVAESPWLAVLVLAGTPAWKETGLIWLFGFGAYLIWKKKFGPAMATMLALAGWLLVRILISGGLYKQQLKPYHLLNPTVNMDFVDSFFSHVALIGHNLRVAFLPFELSSDYSRGTLPLPGYPLQIWVLATAAFLGLLWRWRRDIPPVIWISLVSILPTLDVTGTLVIIFAERFGYPFRFAVAYLLFLGFEKLWPLIREKSIAVLNPKVLVSTLAFIVFFGFSYLSFIRHQDWRSITHLFSRDVATYPFNPKLQFNLGIAYGGASNWIPAREHLVSAVNMAPDFPEAHYRLGLVYRALGENERAQEHFRVAHDLGWIF